MRFVFTLVFACGFSCSAGETPGRPADGRGGASGTSSTGTSSTGTSGGSGGGAAAGGSGGTSMGGAGTGGSGGASGKGGTAIRDAASDVSFDWPEGPRGQCKPGTYEGRFDCLFSAIADAGIDGGLFTMPVSGPITLHLTQSQNGEFLEVKDGVLDGTANTFFTLKAAISGTLNCRTGEFAGALEKGTYSGLIFVNGTWTGRITANYDRMTFRFPAGTWLMFPDIGGECVGGGSWMASYTGP
jgi:hypothetical protein